MKAIPFSVNHFFQWKVFVLMETTAGSGSYSSSQKPFLLAKVIHFDGNHCPQWKLLLLVEAIFSSGCHLLYWKLFVLVENALFNRNYSFQWELLFLVETTGLQQYSFHLVETVPFSGRHFLHWKLFLLLEAIHFSENHSFQWKPFLLGEAFYFVEIIAPFFQWKLLPLIETFPFSGSHSFQCFNIFVRRSYHQLRELLNTNDSVRLLKMVNLPCIHIPVEVFRSSHQRCSMKKGVLRNLTKFTGKHLCQSLFFNKVTDLRPAALLNMRLF